MYIQLYTPHMRLVGIEWDDGNLKKCQKHGVPVSEIEQLLLHSPKIAPDTRHSVHEQRYITVGRNHAGRPMFIAFTLRPHAEGLVIRPISARYMHKKEVKSYET